MLLAAVQEHVRSERKKRLSNSTLIKDDVKTPDKT